MNQRIIKFRAWDKDSKQMLSEPVFSVYQEGQISGHKLNKCIKGFDDILMQFTNLNPRTKSSATSTRTQNYCQPKKKKGCFKAQMNQ